MLRPQPPPSSKLRWMGAEGPRIWRYGGSGVPELNQPMDIGWCSEDLSGDREFRVQEQEGRECSLGSPHQMPSPCTQAPASPMRPTSPGAPGPRTPQQQPRAGTGWHSGDVGGARPERSTFLKGPRGQGLGPLWERPHVPHPYPRAFESALSPAWSLPGWLPLAMLVSAPERAQAPGRSLWQSPHILTVIRRLSCSLVFP